GLVGGQIQRSRGCGGRGEGRQVRIVPAGRRGRERVECRSRRLIAYGDRREQFCPGGVGPFGGGNDAGKDVARVTAVAPPHEKIVVVVASQEHSVRQRGQLGGRALLRAPDHATFAIRREAVGVFARVLCGRVPQRDYCDRYRIDEDGLGGTLGARVELAGDI